MLFVAGAVGAVATATPAHAATHPKKSAYGAIAYEPGHRATGYSYDFKSAREAKIEALRQCGDPACEVLVSFHNACGAIAQGPGKPVYRHGRDTQPKRKPRRCAAVATRRARSSPGPARSNQSVLRFADPPRPAALHRGRRPLARSPNSPLILDEEANGGC